MLLLVSLLFVLSSPVVMSGEADGVGIMCRHQEREALLDLKKAAQQLHDEGRIDIDAYNNQNVWFKWDEDEEECCRWQGVHCNEASGRVIEVRLPVICGQTYYDGMSPAPCDPGALYVCGSLPSSLSRLESLEVLDLRRGCFSGTLSPLTFANLSHLDLSGNFFNFFPHLPLLPHLSYLNLSNLKYAGMIFGEFNLSKLASSAPNLEYLDLSNNQLEGVVSEQIGTLHNLLHLNLVGNSFQNPLPWPSLANLSSLSYLGLGSSDLEIPPLVWEASREAHWQCNWKALESLSCVGMRFASNDSLPFCLEDIHIVSKLKDLSFQWHQESIRPLLRSLSLKNASLSLRTMSLQGSLSEADPALEAFALETPFLELLDLSENGWLTGIPFWLPHLPSLKSLSLRGNALTGPIPRSLLKPSYLHLDLSDNSLSGVLPLTIGNLSSLSYLNLSHNKLTGEIPLSIGNLSKLYSLDLSGNTLTGAIPLSIGNLSCLYELYLSLNSLTGEIPFSIGKLSSLSYLFLQANNLTGEIPLSIGSTSSLVYLILSSNNLRGEIPLSLRNLSVLHSLALSGNNISGTIPTYIFQNSLFELYLSNNYLSGNIPREVDKSTSLRYLDLSNNYLIGALPAEIGNCSNLIVLRIERNFLSSKIPSSLGKLRQTMAFMFQSNKFIGVIPEAIQNCSSLMVLDLKDNQFSGTIPKWITGENLPHLESLILSNNQLQGSQQVLESLIQNLTHLRLLDLASNHLSGFMPSNLNCLQAMTEKGKRAVNWKFMMWVTNSQSFQVDIPIKSSQKYLSFVHEISATALDFSNNWLEGQIPSGIGALKWLYRLNLSHNALNGSIPNSLGDLLQTLDLSNNKLTGIIPAELCRFGSLGVLDLSHNRLKGTISSSCTQLCTFNASCYAGNDELHYECFATPKSRVKATKASSPVTFVAKIQEYISLQGWGLGHALGFLIVSLLLHRRALFGWSR